MLSIDHVWKDIFWLLSDAMNNQTAVTKAPNEWTHMQSSSGLITFVVTTLLSYLAGYESVSARPLDPDTMTFTALEAIASSSCKNGIHNNLRCELLDLSALYKLHYYYY